MNMMKSYHEAVSALQGARDALERCTDGSDPDYDDPYYDADYWFDSVRQWEETVGHMTRHMSQEELTLAVLVE